MKKSLICIGCPLGCMMTATLEYEAVIAVEGNTCGNGEKYAIREITSPARIVTSTIKVIGGDVQVLSVKTKDEIPKEKIFNCIEALKDLEVSAPVKVGDIILRNVADTGIDIVATKCVDPG